MQYSEDEDRLEELDRQYSRAEADGDDGAAGSILANKGDLYRDRGDLDRAAHLYLSACACFSNARLPAQQSEMLFQVQSLGVNHLSSQTYARFTLCRYRYCSGYVDDDAAVGQEIAMQLDGLKARLGADATQTVLFQVEVLRDMRDGLGAAKLCRTTAQRAKSAEYGNRWDSREYFLALAYLEFSALNREESAREVKRLIDRSGLDVWMDPVDNSLMEMGDRVRSARRDPATATIRLLSHAEVSKPLGLVNYYACMAALLDYRVYSSPDGRQQLIETIRRLVSTKRPFQPPATRTFMTRWRAGVLITIWRVNRLRHAVGLSLADLELQFSTNKTIPDRSAASTELEVWKSAASRSLVFLCRRASRMDRRYRTSNYSAFADSIKASLAEAEASLLAKGPSSLPQPDSMIRNR